MKVLVISKNNFQSQEFTDVTSITYNASTKVYTITHSNAQTFTASSDLYYISVLWG